MARPPVGFSPSGLLAAPPIIRFFTLEFLTKDCAVPLRGRNKVLADNDDCAAPPPGFRILPPPGRVKDAAGFFVGMNMFVVEVAVFFFLAASKRRNPGGRSVRFDGSFDDDEAAPAPFAGLLMATVCSFVSSLARWASSLSSINKIRASLLT